MSCVYVCLCVFKYVFVCFVCALMWADVRFAVCVFVCVMCLCCCVCVRVGLSVFVSFVCDLQCNVV